MAAAVQQSICIGIDIGGTFTDAIVSDGKTTLRAKALTTPDNLANGVIDACTLVAKLRGEKLEELLPHVDRFGLGTTAVTNVLASRTGRQVGFLTTQGFEDLVPLANGHVESRDGWLVTPWQIVSRRRTAGIDERIDRDGRVLKALDPDEVVRAVDRLVKEEGVDAIAISFLWSFRNPTHEEQAVAALAKAFPKMMVTAGAPLLPQMREYERATLALLNAYTSGALRGIDSLAAALKAKGLRNPLLLMHSSGGSITVDEARRVPIGLAESGPAAGVAAAAAIATDAGFPNAISCDMGGTTLDIAIIQGREPLRKNRGAIMGIWTAMSLVDVDSIGAGGGSMAWIDSLGILKVGPKSAGANPGPACYGRGGTAMTVTDALLLTGFIDEGKFLGGAMKLDRAAAMAACASLAAQLHLPPEQVAWGIREIALSDMVKAVRARLTERGLDAKEHAFISYGGCGGLFSADIAKAIGSRTVLFPELASVLSAFGAAATDIRRERIRSMGTLLPVDAALLKKNAQELRDLVDGDLRDDGVAAADRRVTFEADLRFYRQRWELSIPVTAEALYKGDIDKAVEDFRMEYGRRYGTGAMVAGSPMELTNLRAIGIGHTLKASLNQSTDKAKSARAPSSRTRPVQLARDSAPADVPVVDGKDLMPGHELHGPTLVDGADTTIWIPGGSVARVDGKRGLLLEAQS